ncbi:hypothetical protein HK100_000564 [Physocladia obscura]|uniref:Cytochrome P450 n=1 Tax=Physocladia obscura TaxID=109957 RepID=A0AAD5XF51_9FUNG|nr:hypothetical protein HK100_000564 [Physocladia obscura]
MYAIFADIFETVQFALTIGIVNWLAQKAEESRQNGERSIIKTALLGKTISVISSPEGLRRVFYNERICKRNNATIVTSKILTLGNSEDTVVELDGQSHTTRKAFLNNITHVQAINNGLQYFVVAKIEKLIADIKRRIHSSPNAAIDIHFYHELELCTWQIGLQQIIGLETTDEDNDGTISIMRTWKKGYNAIPVDIPFTNFHYAILARNKLYDIIRDQLSLHRKNPSAYPHTILTILLAHNSSKNNGGGGDVSDDAIVHEILHMIEAFTGIPMAVAATLINLSQADPKHTAALSKELNTSADLQSILKAPTVAGLDCLPVLSRTVKEGLRTGAVLVFRLATCIETTEFEGVIINAGETVMANFWGVHKSPDVYVDPNVFNPERWVGNEFGLFGPSGDGENNPNGLYEFVPFGGSLQWQRQCSGSTTAFSIVRFIAAKLLNSLDFEISQNQSYDWKSNLVVPSNQMPCIITAKVDRNEH